MIKFFVPAAALVAVFFSHNNQVFTAFGYSGKIIGNAT